MGKIQLLRAHLSLPKPGRPTVIATYRELWGSFQELEEAVRRGDPKTS
jgi:hypothetical protein